MINLGLSLYPEQEKLEEIDAYLKLASKYGFKKIFTSMFSVEGTKEEVFNYFKNFTDIAHKYGMVVSGDCNSEFFEKLGATPTDLSIFNAMGIDIIRMDFSFQDERDAILINNQYGIKIEMSTGFIDVIERAIANGANPNNISTCHNFYPQRYTGSSLEAIDKVNEYWKNKGIPVAIFISSQEKGTHGPWPVSQGLPTMEIHRQIPIESQLKHCMAMKNIDEVIIGNAYASEEEFKAIDKVMKAAYIHVPKVEGMGMVSEVIPSGDLKRIPFKIELDEGITDLEKEILFDYPTHMDLGTALNYVIRSPFPRFIYRKDSIPFRKTDKKVFTKGDVVIVNDNLKHYHGEIQIVMKDIEADGERNYLGRIVDEELMILNHIKDNDVFTFLEK